MGLRVDRILYPKLGMKMSLVCALLIFFSMGAMAKPPYSGTVFVDPDILLAEDPSAFIAAIPEGTGIRQMYDRRVNNWIIADALLFVVHFTGGKSIEFQINPEFELTEAADKAVFYGHTMGQLPAILRQDVQTVWIH